MTEFYTIFARKYFYDFLAGGGGQLPLLPVSYAYASPIGVVVSHHKLIIGKQRT